MIFIATIDTTIYDVDYTQGQVVDTTDWNRAQLLQYLGNGLITLAGGGISQVGAIHLDDLGDVVAPSPGQGYVLSFGTDDAWEASAPYELGLRLTDMTDVDLLTTPPTDGQALVFDATTGKWEPGAAIPAGGGDAAAAGNEVVVSDTDPGDPDPFTDLPELWVDLSDDSGGVPGGGGGGLALADVSYRHVQAVAANTWTVNHGLGFRPNITAVDSAGTQIIPGSVAYTSPTALTLTFSTAVGGEAYCS